MRGMPTKIQTPEDLRNIFALWQDATWQSKNGPIDTQQFYDMLTALCEQQFWHVPIIKHKGKTVTTRFFHEVAVGSKTNGGLKVTSFEHFTPPEDLPGDEGEEDNGGPTCSKITLSAALPKDEKFLHIRNECNCLDINGFDVDEINTIREALQGALANNEAEGE